LWWKELQRDSSCIKFNNNSNYDKEKKEIKIKKKNAKYCTGCTPLLTKENNCMFVSHFNVKVRSQTSSSLSSSFLVSLLQLRSQTANHLQKTKTRSFWLSFSLVLCPDPNSGRFDPLLAAQLRRFAAAKPAFFECAARWRCDAAVHFWPLRSAPR